MKSHAQVVVIGGGVVGASVLYHLTTVGITDVVLLERTELTAGSTWHSAGGMHTLNGDPNVASLQRYTFDLYAKIEAESGQDCSIVRSGGVMLADTLERLDWLKMAHARGRYLGMETEIISAQEAAEIMPLVDPQHFVGAMYDAHEGHLDPSGVTHAYAKCARNAGAEVYRNCWARGIERTPDRNGASGNWRVQTYDTATGEDTGVIECEHLVNCGGLWAREVGRMVGLELPVLAMEHMYFLTESIPEVVEHTKKTGEQIVHAIDFAGEIYTRQEGEGMLLGTYERACVPWSPQNTPWDFSMKLLEPDLERIAPSLEIGFTHFPAMVTAGIRRVVNGPFTFSPDGNPLVGPVRGLPRFWSACAVMAGLSQGGGVGLALANWIADGNPGFDVWGMDIARFGDYATLAYTNAKVRENYSRRFRITFPNEFLPEARHVQTSPIYDRLVSENAVFGDSFGLESALWFQESDKEPVEEVTFGRSNAWDRVRAETLAVRSSVGLLETTGFSKFYFTGAGARDWLNWVLAGRVPAPGRIALSPMTNKAGNLVGDLTVACLPAAMGHSDGVFGTITGGATSNDRDQESFVVFGSGIAERYYQRWFDHQLSTSAASDDVGYQTLGAELCGLSIAGPASRALLENVTDYDISNFGMRFMSFTEIEVGYAPVWCGRISFTGDLGYELWMPARYQRYVYDLLREAGKKHDMSLFGLHALNSLRLEKNFGSWAREYRPIYDPFEAGLGRFVRMDKAFIGRDTLAVKWGEDGQGLDPSQPSSSKSAHESSSDTAPWEQRPLKLCSFVVDTDPGPAGADVVGDEPIWCNGEVVGWVTSGGYAHHSEASVALGYVPRHLVPETLSTAPSSTADFEIEIIGTRRNAKLLAEPLWDPVGERMRA